MTDICCEPRPPCNCDDVPSAPAVLDAATLAAILEANDTTIDVLRNHAKGTRVAMADEKLGAGERQSLETAARILGVAAEIVEARAAAMRGVLVQLQKQGPGAAAAGAEV